MLTTYTMNEILLFGVTREIIGQDILRFEEGQLPGNVGELKRFLVGKYPELKKIASLKVAVNNEFAEEGTKIGPQDEVALIPPVSGG